MAPGSNDAVSSQSLTDVTIVTRRQRLTTSTETLTSSLSLPTLPFDLIPEILCRLHVKLLLQLKCVCKSWKDLISDPKFARKHLHMLTACHDHHHLIVASANTSRDLLLMDFPISSIFSSVSSTPTIPQLQLMFPDTPIRCVISAVSSCDGILLFHNDFRSPLLWNPSIRKFKILPPLLKPSIGRVIYNFGYDRFIHNYKIFAVSSYRNFDVNQWKNEVSVYTLGYDSWRMIDDIPSDGIIYEEGIFVSGTVNWLAFHASGSSLPVLVSLDLEKESYRKQLLTLDLNNLRSTLGVLMDCLCIFTNSDVSLNVWVMKEYGIKESLTKLFSISYMGGDPSSIAYTKVVYVYEDDLLLLDRIKGKFTVYNSRNGTFKIPFKIPKIQNINCWMMPKVYVESLISPCS